MNNVSEAPEQVRESWTDPHRIVAAIRACELVVDTSCAGWIVHPGHGDLPKWEVAAIDGAFGTDAEPTEEQVGDAVPELKVLYLAREAHCWANVPAPYSKHSFQREVLRVFIRWVIPAATGETLPQDLDYDAFREAFERACIMIALDLDSRPEPSLHLVACAVGYYASAAAMWRMDRRGDVDLELPEFDPLKRKAGTDAYRRADVEAHLRGVLIQWFQFDPGKALVKEYVDLALGLNGSCVIRALEKAQTAW